MAGAGARPPVGEPRRLCAVAAAMLRSCSAPQQQTARSQKGRAGGAAARPPVAPRPLHPPCEAREAGLAAASRRACQSGAWSCALRAASLSPRASCAAARPTRASSAPAAPLHGPPRPLPPPLPLLTTPACLFPRLLRLLPPPSLPPTQASCMAPSCCLASTRAAAGVATGRRQGPPSVLPTREGPKQPPWRLALLAHPPPCRTAHPPQTRVRQLRLGPQASRRAKAGAAHRRTGPPTATHGARALSSNSSSSSHQQALPCTWMRSGPPASCHSRPQ